MEDFIGQKVKLTTTVQHLDLPEVGFSQNITSYLVDDPEMEAKLREQFGADVRILPPFARTASNFVSARTNVDLDADGIIIRIRKG